MFASLVIQVGETQHGKEETLENTQHLSFVDVIMSTVSMYLLKSVRFPFMFIGELRIWHGEYHCQAGLCSDGEVSAGDTSGWLLSFCRSDMECISLYNKRDFDCLFHVHHPCTWHIFSKGIFGSFSPLHQVFGPGRWVNWSFPTLLLMRRGRKRIATWMVMDRETLDIWIHGETW